MISAQTHLYPVLNNAPPPYQLVSLSSNQRGADEAGAIFGGKKGRYEPLGDSVTEMGKYNIPTNLWGRK
jgi:hypothetical protein